MPVLDGSWDELAFQDTVQADYLYGYNSAPPCGHQEINACTGDASQSMAPRPLQADCNTAFMAPTWQYGTEHNPIESAGCVPTHASNTTGLPINYTPTKNQFASKPEGLRQIRDHRWKALDKENSDLNDTFLFGHYFESYIE